MHIYIYTEYTVYIYIYIGATYLPRKRKHWPFRWPFRQRLSGGCGVCHSRDRVLGETAFETWNSQWKLYIYTYIYAYRGKL